jgi:hypothetical protein
MYGFFARMLPAYHSNVFCWGESLISLQSCVLDVMTPNLRQFKTIICDWYDFKIGKYCVIYWVVNRNPFSNRYYIYISNDDKFIKLVEYEIQITLNHHIYDIQIQYIKKTRLHTLPISTLTYRWNLLTAELCVTQVRLNIFLSYILHKGEFTSE